MLLKNKIEFFEKNEKYPVKEFIYSLPTKHKAKVLREIDLLEEFGTDLKEPYVKKVVGYKKLWELRIKFASDISRIFYFLPIGNTFVLLHGIVKKTKKTPVQDLEIANNHMNEYLRRQNHEK